MYVYVCMCQKNIMILSICIEKVKDILINVMFFKY